MSISDADLIADMEYKIRRNNREGKMKRIVHSQTSATKSWGAACVRLLDAISGNEQSPYLTDGDRGFVRDMREKAQAYGSGFVASESQVRRLEDLRDRLKEK